MVYNKEIGSVKLNGILPPVSCNVLMQRANIYMMTIAISHCSFSSIYLYSTHVYMCISVKNLSFIFKAGEKLLSRCVVYLHTKYVFLNVLISSFIGQYIMLRVSFFLFENWFYPFGVGYFPFNKDRYPKWLLNKMYTS